MMFLKKVAGSVCNSHDCAVLLEAASTLQCARGLRVNSAHHPQNVIKRCVCKGWDLLTLTFHASSRIVLGPTGVAWWSTRWFLAGHHCALQARSCSTHHCLCTIRANDHTVKEAKKAFAVLERQFWPCRSLGSISGTPGAQWPHLQTLPYGNAEDIVTASELWKQGYHIPPLEKPGLLPEGEKNNF